MLQLQNKTFSLQTDLALYCRTGLNEPQTSIQQHTFHYKRLVYNVIKDTLKIAFPLTRKLIGRKRWKKMVAHFFKSHKCQTPQVWKLPGEFSEYYDKESLPFKKKFIFLKSLLQYEWLEIEVFMMEDVPIDEFRENKKSEKDVIIPNPEIKILSIEFPIHLKNIKEITEEDRGQYFVSIHRDFYTKQVKFNDLSYPFVEIILKANEDYFTKKDFIELLSKYEKDEDKIIRFYNDFEQFALHNNIFLGYN
ncbi:HvfC/BufC N-terminal domain-containing protein [Elizabethkingia anophelis]|uniref:Putative DNA-binding domain-containing protein n=1 Tax=Elizabethkingia anophelis TaxID=1117645 RepID=A0AAU8V1K5_9FLAO|nr:putative DNA-binding domain-containing protein [Elizabethkingia anophelis]AQX02209.1 hypothetical protein BBD32_12415 [Elizabethkingia anophelis]OPB61688.1 hypothetical protein BAY11_17520 [Elizabethkingia anophelis]